MKQKESLSRKIFVVCNITIMWLMAASVLFPYLNVLARALNDGNDTMKGGIVLWPRVFTLENFKAVLGDEAFFRAVLVTIAKVGLGTVLSLFVQFTAAYVFLNRSFWGRKVLMMFLLIPMYFGGGLIAQYMFYTEVGLLNNFLVYILPGCFSVYNMIIIRSYLETIPPSLRESAKVDGASEFTIAFRIIFPLSKPVLATVGLWTAVGHWNDWTSTLYFVTKKNLFTLQYLLMQVLKEAEKIQQIIKQAMLDGVDVNITAKVTSESVQCAQLIITTIPIVLVYPFLQKYFIQGITLGAVKD